MRSIIANSTADYLEQHGTKVNDVYFENICSYVNVHFNMSYLPTLAYSKLLDINNSGSKFQILTDNIYRHINRNECIILDRLDYKDDVFISSCLIGRYISDSIIKDTRIHKVLYVDTPLLLTDYKKMMDCSNDNINPPVLTHSQELLNRDIYNYDYVIWDRFNCVNSWYDLNKLQEIIHHRYLNMCGNMYFCIGKTKEDRLSGVDDNLLMSMNVITQYDLTMETCNYLDLIDESSDKGVDKV